MPERFTESVVESIVRSWLGELQYSVLYAPDGLLGKFHLERDGLAHVVLLERVRYRDVGEF